MRKLVIFIALVCMMPNLCAKTMMRDTVLTSEWSLSESLDLNGHTLHANAIASALRVWDSNLTISNGTIELTSSPTETARFVGINVWMKHLTLNNITLRVRGTGSATIALVVQGDNAQLTLNNCVIEATGSGTVYGIETTKLSNSVWVNGGSIQASSSQGEAYGIYTSANLTCSQANITAQCQHGKAYAIYKSAYDGALPETVTTLGHCCLKAYADGQHVSIFGSNRQENVSLSGYVQATDLELSTFFGFSYVQDVEDLYCFFSSSTQILDYRAQNQGAADNKMIISSSTDVPGVNVLKKSGNTYKCANFVLTDRQDFCSPVDFTTSNTSPETPNYTRTLYGGVNTCCLPFALSADMLPLVTRIWTVGEATDEGIPVMDVTESGVSAGQPCLLYLPMAPNQSVSHSFYLPSGTSVVANERNDLSSTSSAGVQGTYVSTTQWNPGGTNPTGYAVATDGLSLTPLRVTSVTFPFRSVVTIQQAGVTPRLIVPVATAHEALSSRNPASPIFICDGHMYIYVDGTPVPVAY